MLVMRSTILALVLITLAMPAASAACRSVPDGKDTAYIENQAALALCQQQELAASVRLQQQASSFDFEIQHLQTQIDLNQQAYRARQAMPQF